MDVAAVVVLLGLLVLGCDVAIVKNIFYIGQLE